MIKMDLLIFFPYEIASYILSYVNSLVDIRSCRLVSRHWANLIPAFIQNLSSNYNKELPVQKLLNFVSLQYVRSSIWVSISSLDDVKYLLYLPCLCMINIHMGEYSSYFMFQRMVQSVLETMKISNRTKIRISGSNDRTKIVLFLRGNSFMITEFGPIESVNPDRMWGIARISRISPGLKFYTHQQYIHFYMKEIERIPTLNIRFGLEDFVPRLFRPRLKFFLQRADFKFNLEAGAVNPIHYLVKNGICSVHILKKILHRYAEIHGLIRNSHIYLDRPLQLLFPETIYLSRSQLEDKIRTQALIPIYPNQQYIEEYEIPDQPLDLELYRSLSRIFNSW